MLRWAACLTRCWCFKGVLTLSNFVHCCHAAHWGRHSYSHALCSELSMLVRLKAQCPNVHEAYRQAFSFLSQVSRMHMKLPSLVVMSA